MFNENYLELKPGESITDFLQKIINHKGRIRGEIPGDIKITVSYAGFDQLNLFPEFHSDINKAALVVAGIMNQVKNKSAEMFFVYNMIEIPCDQSADLMIGYYKGFTACLTKKK